MSRQIVHVEWVDSSTSAGWKYHEIDNNLPTIHSIGFVIKMDKKAVTISSTLAGDGHGVLDPLTIPAGAIVKLHKVKGVKVGH